MNDVKFKRIGIWLLSVVGIIVALSSASHVYVAYQKGAAQRNLEKCRARDIFTAEELKEDLAYLQNLVERVHPREISSFPLGGLEPALTNLSNSIDQPLSHLSFYLRAAPVANRLNDEHTMLFPPEHAVLGRYEAGGKFFPFDVQFINGNLYIAQNLSDYEEISSGMEVISINGVIADELRKSLMVYYSGTREAQKLFYLQERFREALFLVYGFSDSFELILRDQPTGKTSSYLVNGKAFAPRESEVFHYDVIAPNTILLTYNAFEDESNTFSRFLEEMFATAQKQSIQNLIIDIRRNQGGASAYGDEMLSYLTAEPYTQITSVDVTISHEVKADFISHVPAFIRWLPIQYFHPMLKSLWKGKEGEIASIAFDPIVPDENPLRFAGDVYLLIGPGTMSSASLLAATMKKYGIGTLIGEAAGGYATLYGNVVDCYLPNTGLRIWMPTSVVYGSSVGPIVPDQIVIQTVPDLYERKDTVMQFVQDMIGAK